MNGGLQISTAQGIAALVFLVGTIGTLLGIIRGLYTDRIAKLEARIAAMEERDHKREELIERNQDALNRAVDLLERQASVAETALKARRRTTRSA